jgi:two-component system, OmpR family, response regulator
MTGPISTQRPPASALKAIVLDDSEIAAEAQAGALEDAGFEVRWVCQFRSFLILLQEFQPDVIVADVNMPGVPGDKFCQALRLKGRSPTIVLISAMPIDQLKERAAASGADGHVSKSVGAAEVARQVKAIVTSKRQELAASPA